MDKKIILKRLNQIKPKYLEEGFNIIGLFGSYARGDYNQFSDIDILYEVDDKYLTKYRGFVAISRVMDIKKELSNIFNTKVDLSSISGMNINIKKEIRKEIIYV